AGASPRSARARDRTVLRENMVCLLITIGFRCARSRTPSARAARLNGLDVGGELGDLDRADEGPLCPVLERDLARVPGRRAVVPRRDRGGHRRGDVALALPGSRRRAVRTLGLARRLVDGAEGRV